MPCRDFIHLSRKFFGRDGSLLEQDIGEGDDPTLVISKLADHLGAERLDTPALLLGVDDIVKVEHIGECVAALLPGLKRVLNALDMIRRQAA